VIKGRKKQRGLAFDTINERKKNGKNGVFRSWDGAYGGSRIHLSTHGGGYHRVFGGFEPKRTLLAFPRTFFRDLSINHILRVFFLPEYAQTLFILFSFAYYCFSSNSSLVCRDKGILEKVVELLNKIQHNIEYPPIPTLNAASNQTPNERTPNDVVANQEYRDHEDSFLHTLEPS
jgi:hypothetical protein